MENPFVIQGYQGRKYFCDRQEELQAIENHVINDRNITLYGWRRLGKTSLIHCLSELIKDKHQFETVFIDISTCRTFDSFSLRLFEAVYDQFGKTAKGSIKKSFQKIIAALGLNVSFDSLTGLPTFSFGFNRQAEQKESSLFELFEFLSITKKPILIVFDEFQQVQHIEKVDMEAYLRAITQRYPQLRFLFSGSHRGVMQSMFTSQNRPFYKSTQLINLQPIVKNTYVDFILFHFEDHDKLIAREIVERIYNWCRGETYSIQLICNYLFGSKDKISHQDFKVTRQSILQQFHGMYAELLNLLTNKQVVVLKAIAQNEPVENPSAQKFIQENGLGASSSVQTALKALQDKEIVFKQNQAYYIHDVLLKRWLQLNS